MGAAAQVIFLDNATSAFKAECRISRGAKLKIAAVGGRQSLPLLRRKAGTIVLEGKSARIPIKTFASILKPGDDKAKAPLRHLLCDCRASDTQSEG
ncbi:hypothetical protein [Tabrizicola fusiformis]|uniref:hypothetical protein n=1 Tax=Tabrizicola sp. SY72 TaxID=2741673 RepID=UPI0015732304|nr:hypothetical protein [Tabrizicola sp. SY72]NTT88374.1 hypothetical protein [Tabrizicola sp. SY72]